MLRLLIFIGALLLTLSKSYASPLTTIDLDTLTQINITSGSDVIVDDERNTAADTLLTSPKWQALGRDQLRFGRSANHIWLKQTFHTQGSEYKIATLQLHRLIDESSFWLYNQGQLVSYGKATRKKPTKYLKTNTNVHDIVLKPNQTYTLLLDIESGDSIIGAVEILDADLQKKQDITTIYYSFGYIIFILAMALYNITAYFSTQQRAFIFHGGYVISLLIVQASEFNYLLYYFPELTFHQLKSIILAAICTAYGSVILFSCSILEHKNNKNERFFIIIDKILLCSILSTLLMIPFFSYHFIILLISYNVFIFLTIGIIYLAYAIKTKNPHALTALLLIFIFTPSMMALLPARLGMVNITPVSEYALYFSIIIETLFISALLYKRLRSIRFALERATYIDYYSQLPNQAALKKTLTQQHTKNNNLTLIHIWLSGLEKIEAAFGVDFKKEYTHKFITLLNDNINQHSLLSGEDGKLYACGINKFSIIYHQADEGILNHLYTLTISCINTINQKYQCSLDIRPIIAGCNKQHYSLEEFLVNADFTLAHCLRHNYNKLFYDKNIGEKERRQLTLTNEFMHSIGKNEIFLHWQPQFDTNNHIVGLEALARWQHPSFGMVSPTEFIPLLENSFQIKELTRWVILESFNKTQALQKTLPGIDISINLSAHDIIEPSLIKFIDEQLINRSDIAKFITLEITESMLLEDNKDIVNIIKKLQGYGFKISIDDFGAGYASFGYLQTLPVNELKIDKRYIDACDQNNSQAIIRSIIDLAKRLKMQIVAEGIEHQSQVEIFQRWGVHRLQGWKLAKPMLLEDVIKEFNVNFHNKSPITNIISEAKTVLPEDITSH